MYASRGQPPSSASSSSSTPSQLQRRSSSMSNASAPSAPQSETTSLSSIATNKYFGPPVVLTPISQINRSPRKNSRTEAALAAAEKATKFDPDYYNPDGSLRTMHKLPHFEQSYAQAMQARYIRHNKPIEREQELSVQQIFEKK
ncbi:hypothetical protein RRG08_050407 [Elysia crispata]|uniref:Uncharacterized protein n=1 Tax=Elysia crispata TaxID=231223 RepID=A0AAE0ZM95_9GAST|nr:hypothetical protein RRG08_050407 [Elysia crispata]